MSRLGMKNDFFYLFLLCLICPLLSWGKEIKIKIDNDALTKPEYQWFQDAAAISPDGTKVAFASHSNQRLYLNVIELDSNITRKVQVEEDRPHPNNKEKVLVQASMRLIDWVNNTRIVYKPNQYSLLTINDDFTDETELLQYKDVDYISSKRAQTYISRNLINVLPDQPDYVLIESRAIKMQGGVRGYSHAERFGLYLANINTGNVIPLSGDDTHLYRFFADQWGNLRGGMKYTKGQFNEVVIWDEKASVFKGLEEMIGEDLVEKFRFNFDASKIDQVFGHAIVMGFGYDPELMYFCSNLDRNTTALYAINLKSKEVGGPFLESERFDLVSSTASSSVNQLIFSSEKKQFLGFRYEDVRWETVWFAPEFKAAQKSIDQLLPNDRNVITSWDQTFQRFLVESYSPNNPGTVSVFDLKSNSTRTISDSSYKGNSYSIPFWIPTRTGGEVLCYVNLPKTAKPGHPVPMVVLLHGGPWLRDSWNYSREVQKLINLGYGVLRVNFRSSGGFGKDHIFSTQKRFGDAALEDCEDAIDFLITNKLASRDQLAMMGGSYGGYLSLYAAAKRPDLFKCVVAVAAVTDLPRLIKEERHRSNRSWANYIFKRDMIGHPSKDKKLLKTTSPLFLSDQFQAPILFIHGEDDRVVPIEHSRNLYRKIEKRIPGCEFYEYEKAGHGGWTPNQEEHYYKTIEQFLKSYLGTPVG